MEFLHERVKTTRVINATAAGTTAVNGTVLDHQGFENVRFVALLGTLTATQVTALKAQQGDASDGSDMADITGAVTANAADADSNKMLVLDVSANLITKRYVRCVVTRGTANAVIDGVIADQYYPGVVPTTHPTSTLSQAKKAF